MQRYQSLLILSIMVLFHTNAYSSVAEMWNKFLLKIAGPSEPVVIDSQKLNEMKYYKEKISNVLPSDWRIDTGYFKNGFSVFSKNKYRYKYYTSFIDSNLIINIRFDPPIPSLQMKNEVIKYDSICFKMKELYKSAYPNTRLPRNPFIQIQSTQENADKIKQYNSLSSELWVGNLTFPKYYSTNSEIRIISIPMLFPQDTTFQEIRNVINIIGHVFNEHVCSCKWELKP